APDLRDVDGQLTDRLARVQQVEPPVPSGDLTDPLGRVDQPAVGRNVGDGDQLGAFVDQVLQGRDVHRAGLVVGRDDDLNASGGPGMQEGQVVAGVLGHPGHDCTA